MLVENDEDAAVDAAQSVDLDRWWPGFGELLDRIGGRFTRYEPRRQPAAVMLGLFADLERKNCWSIAEHRGAGSPDALQHLLSRAVWDADLVRHDLRGYVVDHLFGPDAVLVVDETGDLKKGTATVGVQRRYAAPPAGAAARDRRLVLLPAQPGVRPAYSPRWDENLGIAVADRQEPRPESPLPAARPDPPAWITATPRPTPKAQDNHPKASSHDLCGTWHPARQGEVR